jgi:hypothetical protein
MLKLDIDIVIEPSPVKWQYVSGKQQQLTSYGNLLISHFILSVEILKVNVKWKGL